MVIIIQRINEEPGFTHEPETSAIVSFEQWKKIYFKYFAAVTVHIIKENTGFIYEPGLYTIVSFEQWRKIFKLGEHFELA